MNAARSPHPRCRGFTIVELLVAISIVGVIMAMLLPAIAASREAARRSECLNNLRQIGVAMHDHLNVKKTFPPGAVEWRPAGNKTRRQLAWCVFLLPYLDEQAIFDRLDLQQAFDSPANATAAAQILPVFICPSSRRGSQRVDGRGACDYGGIYGERISGPNQPPKGLMIYDHAFRDTDVRDGLSSTLIVGEDSAWPDGQWINGRNVFDQAFAINTAPPFENDIRSHHPGGAQATFADGAARFLQEQIDLKILAALCTRAGREVIPANAY